MTPQAGRLPRDNPFSSRHVRPRALPFLFGAGESLASLVERLASRGWWGQIVGPHGSGKSTLLAALLAELESRKREPHAVRLSQQQRRLPEEVWQIAGQPRRRLLVIDGYEQMGFWARRRLRAACRRHGHSLVVTAHRSMGLPELYRTAVTPALARQVLDTLLTESQRDVVGPFDLAGSLAAHKGNFREVLFALYDLYEEQTHSRASP
jgi:hypothetical protein